MGTVFLGTICPEGPINWGPIVGDQMSGDPMCLGTNMSQPKLCEFEKCNSSLENLHKVSTKIAFCVLNYAFNDYYYMYLIEVQFLP